MADLSEEIVAYQAMQPELESNHMGKWALVHDRALVGVYDSFEDAAAIAVAQFGRGPYLIRQVGAAPPSLPASVMYQIGYAHR